MSRKTTLMIKRLPGTLYRYRYTVYTVLVVVLMFVYLLFRWNFVCSNLQSWQHIQQMCSRFHSNQAIGSLCIPLCVTNEISTVSCNSFQSNKEAVFTTEWHNTKMVFKKATSKVNSIHWYDNGKLKYPSERDFIHTIKAIVLNKLNLNISNQNAGKLSRLKPNYHEMNALKRQREIEDLWVLLQDNEYLISSLYTDRDIFPQLLGTCGDYYAVEQLDPIQNTNLVMLNYEKEDWGSRLKTALLIIELLDELENGFHEHYHLCDIKIEHFGFTKAGTKVKFIDLIGVHTKSTVDAILKQIPSCETDEDCEYLDCRGRCDIETNKCSTVMNNNLQIVCEKIFVGWRMSNTVLIPGLLMVPHAPSELATVLRHCSNPHMEHGKPRGVASEDVKKRLYNTLIEMDEVVNEEN